MLRVVFHVNELEKWPVIFGNIKNILKERGDVDVKIVVNGHGITGYLEPALMAEINLLQSQVIQFEACQNALKGHKIQVRDLPTGVKSVPSGVIRLIELQQEGFAYLKP